MADQSIAQSPIRLELDRILASKEFSRADYLCRFLRCCVEQTISGNISQLKEFWLGRSVFQRDKTFDPSADPIVRVQARRLRQKLDRYYENEGRNSTVRIVLPVGTYVPHFLTGEQIAAQALPARKIPSIAVLPFIPSSRTEEAQTLADVLTDELVHSIVEAARFHVVSRLSSARFKDAPEDARAIGKALNADLLMEGHIHSQGRGWAISVQLTDAVSGYHLRSLNLQIATVSNDREAACIARQIAAILEAAKPPSTKSSAELDLKKLTSFTVNISKRTQFECKLALAI